MPCPNCDCADTNARTYRIKEGPAQPVHLGNCTQEFLSDLIAPGGETTTRVTETGCLSDPGAANLINADRCPVTEVLVNGQSIIVTIPENWTNTEFVDAVNTVVPNTLEVANNGIVIANSISGGTLEIVCLRSDFLETFGTSTGAAGSPTPGISSLISPPMDNGGATTTYTFENSTDLLLTDHYHVGRVKDNRYPQTQLRMGLDDAAVDASGNTDGNVFSINGSSNAGTFYEQTVSGLTVGSDYQVEIWYASLNPPGFGGDLTKGNLTVEILDGVTVLATANTGLIPHDSVWHSLQLRFVATAAIHTFKALNSSTGTSGNDIALDQISFSTVRYQQFALLPSGSQYPVEIVKVLTNDGSIQSLRVYSPDGSVEYTIPDPDGRILTTGPCYALSTSSGGGGGILQSVQTPNYELFEGIGVWVRPERVSELSFTVLNDGGSVGYTTLETPAGVFDLRAGMSISWTDTGANNLGAGVFTITATQASSLIALSWLAI